MTSSSRVLLSLPLYHVSGISLVFRNFLSGATLVIPQDNVITTTLLEDKKISHVSLVFTQYSRLLNAFNKRILITLKAVLLGGSSFPSISLKKGIEKNLPLYLSYGLTEMSSAVCCNPLLKTHNIKSCGHLLPFRKLKIDKRGEILVSGKTLFKGYYCTKNQVLIPRKRWFKTKDLGIFFSKEGLFLQGRKDRLIITGGENIQPEEIEQILLSIEGVNQALILGLPDKEFGQKIVAVIRSDSFLCLDELANKLSQHLPRYKLPKAYLPWPKALESSSLKVSHILKEELFKYAATYISFSNNLNSS